jgi:hypothetical protein
MNQCLKTILINLVVVLVLLGAVELGFRLMHGGNKPPPPNSLSLYLVPYYMFSNEPHSSYTAWVNMFTNEIIPANVVANDHGFNDRRGFGFMAPYHKAENERVVLFTGGSSGWGVGSPSAETTVAGRMEYHLNSLQRDLKYTVINLAMGSWIAYQQFIGLELWGAAFHPDWVVSMDGHNDAGVGCSYSQGVMNPLFFPAMQSYVNAYLGSGQGRPTFYRGWLENELIKYSVAYRTLTGKTYIHNPQIYDETNKDATREEYRKIIVPTKIGESRKMLTFYLKAQSAMLGLFPQARYILSTQPMVNQFTGDFTDAYADMDDIEKHRAAAEKRIREVDLYLAANEDKWCNTETYQPSFVYVYVKGALELERLAEQASAQGRLVEYHNIGRLFPNDRAERMPFFIDPAHLSEKGADVVGRFYAERILAADNAGQVK